MASSPFSPWRRLVRDYFTFPKWQRRSLILIWLGIACLVVVKMINARQTGTMLPLEKEILLTAVTELKMADDSTGRRGFMDEAPKDWAREQQPTKAYDQARPLHPFAFDPNTVSEGMLTQMGWREKAIQNLLKYRASGGKFRRPEDLAKLYSLKPEESARLIPFVNIMASQNEYKKDSFRTFTTLPAKPSNKSNSIIDINMADTNAWKSLPGIGSKLSARIVKFREKLGGFYSIGQVGETFALPDSTFQNIKPRLTLGNPAAIATLDINLADAATLKNHPYMSWALANAIVQYRTQHGPIQKLDDLLKIHLADGAWLNKIRPYLRVQ